MLLFPYIVSYIVMIILDLSPFPKILKPGGHYLLVLLIIDFSGGDLRGGKAGLVVVVY